MKKIPQKIKSGSHIRVIAPSSSIAIISEENQKLANKKLEGLGFSVSFGKNVGEIDDFKSSSITYRVNDLHEAFADPSVDAVFAVIGGFNCNQLLSYIDWKIIRDNPKIFIGYSDTTALGNAIYAKCGLVTYSGPAWSTFSQKLHSDYTLEYFKKCLIESVPFSIVSAEFWTDDKWYLDQDDRHPIKNTGWKVLNEGEADGIIIGGNLCTLNLLQGTEYFPDLNNSILFIEDDEISDPFLFDRDLQSLIHQKNFNKVKGLIIGRFQKASNMEDKLLYQIIKSKKELDSIPVIAGVDFGHTSPMITFPIGGTVRVNARVDGSVIEINKH